MSVNTLNAYGRITILEDAIAQIAGLTALECYGVVDLVAKKLSDSVADLKNIKKLSKGVKVTTSGDRIYIDLYVIFKYGVSIEAVGEALRNSIKYSVENFTGMLVEKINVFVAGIKV